MCWQKLGSCVEITGNDSVYWYSLAGQCLSGNLILLSMM